MSEDGDHRNYRSPNWMTGDQLYLQRCYECGGERGRENWGPAVATGECAWCGWPNGPAITRDDVDRAAGTGRYGGGPGKFRGERPPYPAEDVSMFVDAISDSMMRRRKRERDE